MLFFGLVDFLFWRIERFLDIVIFLIVMEDSNCSKLFFFVVVEVVDIKV